jgi:hypothetical protein
LACLKAALAILKRGWKKLEIQDSIKANRPYVWLSPTPFFLCLAGPYFFLAPDPCRWKGMRDPTHKNDVHAQLFEIYREWPWQIIKKAVADRGYS